jgi:hypothetical protein
LLVNMSLSVFFLLTPTVVVAYHELHSDIIDI